MPKTRIQGIAEVLPGGTRGRLEFDFVDAQPVPGVVLETVPTPDQVRTKVDIHASRMPIGDNDIRVALHNIQNNLGVKGVGLPRPGRVCVKSFASQSKPEDLPDWRSQACSRCQHQ